MGNASSDPFLSQAIEDIREKALNHAECDELETLEQFKQELIRTRAMHLQILERLDLVWFFPHATKSPIHTLQAIK